jgi:FkbM family methyltransferase
MGERQMNDFIYNTAKHRDLIYDVGMHRGEDTEFYLQKGFRVVAFEADPELVNSCRIKFNEFINQGKLTIMEGAIVDPDKSGQKKVSFYKNNTESIWGTTCIDWAERNKKFGTDSSLIEVDIVNFEDAIKEHGIPYYMKVDIEGCDAICLNALKRFRERPDYISIESDKTSFANIRNEIDLFVSLGYDSFQAVEQSAKATSQSPPLPPREGNYVAHHFDEVSSGLFGAELDDKWKSKHEILCLYRFILMGYYLLGDNGIMNRWKFPGAGRLRSLAWRFLKLFTRAPAIPGWYDTHARHSCTNVRSMSELHCHGGGHYVSS